MKGFSLIELLVYLCVLSLLIVLIMRFVVSSSFHLTSAGTYAQQLIQLYSVQARMTRDLRAAPAEALQWLSYNNNQLVWHDQDHDIGWSLEGENLVRRQGTFDQRKGTWHANATSLAAIGITKAQFLMSLMRGADDKEYINVITVHLECTLSGNTQKIVQWVVVPRTGRLV